MAKRRSEAIRDITGNQVKCQKLMEEVDLLYSSKCKTFRSAFHHLNSLLNKITNINELD